MVETPPGKHIVYFEVLEALDSPGCPVCRLGLRAVSRHLDALSYEGVNDPRARAELRAARGFCRQHAWQFAEEVRDGLGTAIIYRDVAGELLRVLLGGADRDLRPRTSPALLASRLAQQQECPACRLLDQSSRRYLDTLAGHLGDEAFRRRYLASGGLCLPHLTMALERVATRPERGLLAEAFVARVASLAVEDDAASLVEAMVGKEGAVRMGRPAAPLAEQEGARGGQELFGDREESSQGQCAVCWAVGRGIDGWLRRWAAAWPEAGAQEGDGPAWPALCNRHLWRLLRVAGASAALPSLRGQAQSLARALHPRSLQAGRAERWRGLLASLRRAMAAKGGGAVGRALGANYCPACAMEAALERRAALAVVAGDGRVAAPEVGKALCVPHLRLALGLATTPAQAELLALREVEALRALGCELSEYIRKQDYRFRHEPLGAEVDAPWRAIAQVAGARWP